MKLQVGKWQTFFAAALSKEMKGDEAELNCKQTWYSEPKLKAVLYLLCDP